MSEKNSPRKYFVCGGFGGLFQITVGYPMDTIKVRLQAMPLPKPGEPPLYTGTIDCVVKSVRTNGFKSLYRGMSTPLIFAGPINALNFCGFYLGKEIFESDPDNVHSMPELFAAGSISGIIASILTAPSEHVKCLLQAQDASGPHPKYKGSIDCFKQLYAEGGIKNIYKGTLATILRDVPAAGMYFMSYVAIKDVIVQQDASAGNKLMCTIFAGGFAGTCYWLVGMPADVLKTRLQSTPTGTYPNGVRDVFKRLMAIEGPSALYVGLTPVMIRAFPANAATFVGFELGLKLYDWIMPDL
ncbi:unnamed protein product [Arctia plantaginis]|uniref:Uncharacterized protein n=1 Tax=Arctia plantaginis TaxID=874455 RepID=A0A8S0ZJY9_ARCPL|nr:unnamed protein product [Arctia plantaginis]